MSIPSSFGKGQSLAEYALPVAIIALVAIPALVLLSNNLGTFASETLTTIKGNPEAAYAAALQNTRWQEASTGKQLGPYQAKYDNGNIHVKVPSFLGGGQANFAEGTGATRSLAQMLKRLAKEYRDENGKPMPSELRKRIEQLAKEGHQLAQAEAAFNHKKENGKQGDYMAIIKAYQDYYQQFNSVKQELNRQKEKGRDYAEAKDIIRGYSGIISANAYANYTDNWDKGDRKGTDPYNTKKYLVGEQPQRTVSRQKTPKVTHTSSDGVATSL